MTFENISKIPGGIPAAGVTYPLLEKQYKILEKRPACQPLVENFRFDLPMAEKRL